MPKEFECRREVVLPATPERVWEAVATNEGLTAWQFPSPFASPREAATDWAPPNHLAVRIEQGEWFNELEYAIEGRNGATSALRYVHCGIFLDDWDTQYDAVQQHTDFYLHTLGQYLEFFDGQRATYIGDVPGGLLGPPRSADTDGFERLKGALGLDTDVTEGDRVRLELGGPGGLDAVLDYARGNFLGLRTKSALYRFFGRNAFGAPVGLSIHVFDESADTDALAATWRSWLERELA